MPNWLHTINFLFKIAIKKCRIDIHLMNYLMILCCKRNRQRNILQKSDRSKYFFHSQSLAFACTFWWQVSSCISPLHLSPLLDSTKVKGSTSINKHIKLVFSHIPSRLWYPRSPMLFGEDVDVMLDNMESMKTVKWDHFFLHGLSSPSPHLLLLLQNMEENHKIISCKFSKNMMFLQRIKHLC